MFITSCSAPNSARRERISLSPFYRGAKQRLKKIHWFASRGRVGLKWGPAWTGAQAFSTWTLFEVEKSSFILELSQPRWYHPSPQQENWFLGSKSHIIFMFKALHIVCKLINSISVRVKLLRWGRLGRHVWKVILGRSQWKRLRNTIL